MLSDEGVLCVGSYLPPHHLGGRGVPPALEAKERLTQSLQLVICTEDLTALFLKIACSLLKTSEDAGWVGDERSRLQAGSLTGHWETHLGAQPLPSKCPLLATPPGSGSSEAALPTR